MLFLLAAGGLVWYFDHEKTRMERKRIAEATKGVGKPKVGGAFELTDTDGKPFLSSSLHGRYSLVCFDHFPILLSLLLQGIVADQSSFPGLLWLHPLPRHLPRGARQDGTDD